MRYQVFLSVGPQARASESSQTASHSQLLRDTIPRNSKSSRSANTIGVECEIRFDQLLNVFGQQWAVQEGFVSR